MSLPTDGPFGYYYDNFEDGTPSGVYESPAGSLAEAPEPYPADAPLDSYAVENLVDDIEFDVPNPEQ